MGIPIWRWEFRSGDGNSDLKLEYPRSGREYEMDLKRPSAQEHMGRSASAERDHAVSAGRSPGNSLEERRRVIYFAR